MMKKFPGIFLCCTLLALQACKDEVKEEKTAETTGEVANLPVRIPYTLLNQYPHNPKAYTEGLQYVDGYMYESAGHYGKSFISKYDLETGKVINEQKLDEKYFGEGLTVMNDKVYVLTWQEKTGFVFDKETFKLLKTFPVQTEEGWGLTNDSTHLIYSDGTSYLYFINPETFAQVKKIEVTDNYGPVSFINELEYINGHIYANQWRTDLILKINPATGKVVAQADLGKLRSQAGIPQTTNDESQPEVLNGIAYDKEKNRILITGKNWPKIFEIKLDN